MKNFADKVIYQIYPKSFKDSNNDGIGDIQGIISKIDYISYLGVDYIWLNPIYCSPQKDNGYDISDYYSIDPIYGTMEEFEKLVKICNEKNIGIMMDMVFNHTSTEHEWFKKAISGEDRYKNYYFFKKGKDNKPPNRWLSKFGNSAWEYIPSMDEYYLHLFDKTQADLNWDNEEVRKELYKIINFWANKGVKGFRFDVINLISKSSFEDDDSDGRTMYTDGKNIHNYLKEMNRNALKGKNILTVGEMSSTNIYDAIKYSNEFENELDTVFSFHHLKVDFCGNDKWVIVPYDFLKLKKIIFEWQIEMTKNNSWNALFWSNHDQPRVVSRFGNTEEYFNESAKMLATTLHLLRGTPYVFQGEEIGMTNYNFTNIDELRDVESINAYNNLINKNISKDDALRIVSIHSRDNGRTTMQWDDTKNGGFTDAIPWIMTNNNFSSINVRSQILDKDSILNHYRRLIEYRHKSKLVQYGDIIPMFMDNENIFAYKRVLDNEELLILSNFFNTTKNIQIKYSEYKLELSNYDDIKHDEVNIYLRPYESLVLYRRNNP